MEFASLASREKDMHHTTILMFEIGTGLPATEIQSIFDISLVQFSHDGRYLAVGSNSGCLSVWAVGEQLLSNMVRVLEAMKLAKDFWHNFPIYLPNYKASVPKDQISFPDAQLAPP